MAYHQHFKPNPGLFCWTGSGLFLTHSMSYSLLTGGREGAGRTADELLWGELQPAGGWDSQHAAWSSKNRKVGQTGTLAGTHRKAIVTSHLGSYLLLKSFYYNVKHPAKRTEHLEYLSAVEGFTPLGSQFHSSCICAILTNMHTIIAHVHKRKQKAEMKRTTAQPQTEDRQ